MIWRGALIVCACTRTVGWRLGFNLQIRTTHECPPPLATDSLAYVHPNPSTNTSYSAEDTVIPARGKGIVKTDLSIAAPPGTYARIAPRSGLAVKKFIDTGAGVVDEDYRGAVGVVLFNHSDDDFEVKKGDRVAQMILERIITPEVVEVDNLDDTTRGAGGYGSTGV